MKTITLQVSDETHELFLKNEKQVKESFETKLKQDFAFEKDRLEQVKIICRAKAPVCNWYDMELQIMKGSI